MVMMDKAEIQKHEDAFLRASTSQVKASQLRDRLFEMEQYLKISDDSHDVLSKAINPGSATCIFDPTKHIIDYLPTPVLHHDGDFGEEYNFDDDEGGDDDEYADGYEEKYNEEEKKDGEVLYDLGAGGFSQEVKKDQVFYSERSTGTGIDSNSSGTLSFPSDNSDDDDDADAETPRPSPANRRPPPPERIPSNAKMHSDGRDAYPYPPSSLRKNKTKFAQSFAMKSLSQSLAAGIRAPINLDPEFDSVFRPDDMRMLALVSHNNMKHSMKQFVIANKNVLKKFRVTGTNTTMTMLKEVFGEDPDVVYGPAMKSGPLGGDAQLVALAVTGELGGCIFFVDPMDSHPHSADIDCLIRQGNVHNILMMNNPCTAHVGLNTIRAALKTGHMEMIPSFFFDLESPSVEAYKLRQKAVLQSNMKKKKTTVRKSSTNGKYLAGSSGGVLKSAGSGEKTVKFAKQSVVVQIMDEMVNDDNLLGDEDSVDKFVDNVKMGGENRTMTAKVGNNSCCRTQ